jgi:hypothetical protein
VLTTARLGRAESSQLGNHRVPYALARAPMAPDRPPSAMTTSADTSPPY